MRVLACALAGCFGLTLSLTAVPLEPPPDTGGSASSAQTPAQPEVGTLDQMRAHAQALMPKVKSELARQFLRAVDALPPIMPRTIYRDQTTRRYLSQLEYDRLEPEARTALKAVPVDETLYYHTKYGSPLAYVRALDLVGQQGFDTVADKRILDFVYGTVGHLRMLAARGGDVTGVDVDSFLVALYSDPRDQGLVPTPEGGDGQVTLIDGRFPTNDATKAAVMSNGGFDLIISKNTLKRGYVHPEREADPRTLIDLGVDDATFVRELFAALNPGGKVMIYNICPAPAPRDKPYIPWADGRCPFERELLEKEGFRVIAFDVDDSEPVREMAHTLGWDQGDSPADLQHDLFAHYTLLERPATP